MTQAVNNNTVSQLSTPDYTGPVQSKIEGQIGKIADLQAEIARLMQEMRDLSPPEHPGADASSEAMDKFNKDMEEFQKKLAGLQGRLQAAQGKLEEAVNLLNQLQTSDMPNAQRKEADSMRKQLDEQSKRLEEASKRMEELSNTKGRGAESTGTSTAQLARQEELREFSTKQRGGPPPAANGVPGVGVP